MKNDIVPKMKAPKIMVEILAYGVESDKPIIKKMFDSIQKQINKSKTNINKVRCLFYIDNGEKTEEEKQQWLIEESNCNFYVFAPTNYKVPDNYITNLMIGPNLFDRATKLIRKEGLKKKVYNAPEVEEESQITEPNEILE